MTTEFGLGRKRSMETPRAASLYNAAALPRETWTKQHRYWWQGGAWIDQGATGSCVGHAFAHRRADATVRKEGLDSQYAIQLYIDASGDHTLQEGTYAINACQILKNRGEITDYFWITSPEELQATLLQRGPVCVGTNWYDGMFYPGNKYGNVYISPDGALAGGHEYVVNGINLEPPDGPPFYRIKNSWGRDNWGLNGTARISTDDLHHLIFDEWGDAVLIREVK